MLMSSNEMEFKNLIKLAKNIVVITGAGISAESGIPTFRGVPSLTWRNYQPESLANMPAFVKNPSLVWEFYHYRREICLKASPNKGHLALSEFELRCLKENKQFSLITQNIDGLHVRAGSKNIIPIHGNLFETKCTKCHSIEANFSSPICNALANRGSPAVDPNLPDIPVEQLPHCHKCNGLLRPNVVWFGESLSEQALEDSIKLLNICDLCMVVGTSAIVQPVASFPSQVIARGVPVAEFNIEKTLITNDMRYFFKGSSALTLPSLLS